MKIHSFLIVDEISLNTLQNANSGNLLKSRLSAYMKNTFIAFFQNINTMYIVY